MVQRRVDFFSFHTSIQMQKMSYCKIEPRRNEKRHNTCFNHATANCFFHRRRMMHWFSLGQVQQISLNTSELDFIHCILSVGLLYCDIGEGLFLFAHDSNLILSTFTNLHLHHCRLPTYQCFRTLSCTRVISTARM